MVIEMTKKMKDKRKPLKPKINLEAGMPRPKPISFRGSFEILEQAAEFPILGCWVMEGWQESGLTPVVVARQASADEIIYGCFLVDYYCLGVKDALWKSGVTLKQFSRELPRLCSDEPQKCDPSLAHELIYGAIEFARQYEFHPHPDFRRAGLVLDPPDAYPRIHRLEFGRDGKPLFVAGLYDDARRIVAKLERTAGPGNFDYIVIL
jgi:hypothetical protein